jgi:four helix bundle protein
MEMREGKNSADMPRRYRGNLRSQVYGIYSRFPRTATLAPSSLILGTAVFVSANLVEGYGRFSGQGNIQYRRQSRESVCELGEHLSWAVNAAITKGEYMGKQVLAISLTKLITGCSSSTGLKKTERRATGKTSLASHASRSIMPALNLGSPFSIFRFR